MNRTVLALPQRAVKPRSSGLTMVIDGGVPLGQFADLIELGAEYIDFVKFGWGTGLIEDVLHLTQHGDIGLDDLLFEAPTTALQTHMITRIGPDVNLGNVPASGVIGLETLRLGLRSDTLTTFE